MLQCYVLLLVYTMHIIIILYVIYMIVLNYKMYNYCVNYNANMAIIDQIIIIIVERN